MITQIHFPINENGVILGQWSLIFDVKSLCIPYIHWDLGIQIWQFFLRLFDVVLIIVGHIPKQRTYNKYEKIRYEVFPNVVFIGHIWIIIFESCSFFSEKVKLDIKSITKMIIITMSKVILLTFNLFWWWVSLMKNVM